MGRQYLISNRYVLYINESVDLIYLRIAYRIICVLLTAFITFYFVHIYHSRHTYINVANANIITLIDKTSIITYTPLYIVLQYHSHHLSQHNNYGHVCL